MAISKACCCIVSFLSMVPIHASDQNKTLTNQQTDIPAQDALTALHTHFPIQPLAQLVLSYVGNGCIKLDLPERWQQKLASTSQTKPMISTFSIVEILQHQTLANTIVFNAHFLEQIKGSNAPQLAAGQFTYHCITDEVTFPTELTVQENRSVRNHNGLRAMVTEFTLTSPDTQHRTIIRPEPTQKLGRLGIHTAFEIIQPDSSEYRLAKSYAVAQPYRLPD